MIDMRHDDVLSASLCQLFIDSGVDTASWDLDVTADEHDEILPLLCFCL
jgi:hypothetical protein